MITVFGALLVTVYMITEPAHWVKKLMQLTRMSWDYKLFLATLGVIYIALAWGYDKYVATRLARALGHAQQRVTGKTKKRKEYKLIREQMYDS